MAALIAQNAKLLTLVGMSRVLFLVILLPLGISEPRLAKTIGEAPTRIG